MDSSDDEKSDQWVESYDSCESGDESDEEVRMPPLKLKQKPKSKKRVVVAADASDESSSSNADSDRASVDSADEKEADDQQQVADKLKANPAWANAMSKVLRTKNATTKKAIVLSKAKKMAGVKEKKPKLDFEIVDEGTEQGKTEPQDDDVKEEKPDLKKRLLIKEQQAKGHVKPSVLDRDHERKLMRIATKSVVLLFNSVRQQQKIVEKAVKKAGKSEQKREKILETIDKKKFLDVLTGSIKSTPTSEKVKVEENVDENSTWSVLRDDFMMGTKLKDWDKREEVI